VGRPLRWYDQPDGSASYVTEGAGGGSRDDLP
jgi:hypothetical protein